jgi:hypothetical protein
MYVAQKAVKSIQGKGWGGSDRQSPLYPRTERRTLSYVELIDSIETQLKAYSRRRSTCGNIM